MKKQTTLAATAALLMLLLGGCGTDSSTQIVYKTINQAPLADAGSDQLVLTGSAVTLDGSGSLDVEASPLAYSWSIASAPAGSRAGLSDTTIVNPQFTPDLNGEYVVSLTVNDGTEESAEQNVTVVASNLPDLSVTVNSVISWHGRVRFNYTVTNQGVVTLVNPSDYHLSFWSDAATQPDLNDTNVTCSITLGSILSPNETYSGTILCSDAVQLGTAYAGVDVSGAIDEVDETNNMSPAFAWAFVNVAPVVDAGVSTNLVVGALSRLTSSAYDLNLGDTVTYRWSILSAPAGSLARLSDATALTPDFTPDLAGDYVLSLTANDGVLDSVASTVHYSAIDLGTNVSADTPLTIPAFSASPIEINSTITVAGGVASVQYVKVFVDIEHERDLDLILTLIAPDGTRVALSAGNGGRISNLYYGWGQNYTGTLFEDLAAESVVSGLAPFNGVYIPQQSLASMNGQPADGNWTLNIVDRYTPSYGGTLKSWAIGIYDISVNAGNAQSVAVGDLVQLDGNASTGVTSYSWGFVSMPVGSTAVLNDATIANPTFRADKNGFYVVELNGSNGTDSFSKTVTIGAFSNSTTYSSTGAVAIPDANLAGVSSPIVVNAAGAAVKIVVDVNITHTWDGDLALALISPSGTRVDLSLHHGGSADNYTATVFDDNAATPIASGAAPFTGSFRPEQALSTMAGENISGTWELFVADQGAPDTGTIDSWDLTLSY